MIRKAVLIAILPAALLTAGCVSQQKVASAESLINANYETVRDEKSCGKPANKWHGVYVAKSGDGFGETGRNVEACFPTRQACHNWLAKANDYGGDGQVVADSCRLKV
ncbi:hypothetical protein [Pseudoxanthobacter sp.]|uniref:hypothetical protein n=1 Tax=Pseudoxanthobacter sp. TaxID=1925742 RepID=UPI002FE34EBF